MVRSNSGGSSSTNRSNSAVVAFQMRRNILIAYFKAFNGYQNHIFRQLNHNELPILVDSIDVISSRWRNNTYELDLLRANALKLTVFGWSIVRSLCLFFFVSVFVRFDSLFVHRFHGSPTKWKKVTVNNVTHAIVMPKHTSIYSFNLISGPLDAMIRNKSHLVYVVVFVEVFFGFSNIHKTQSPQT